MIKSGKTNSILIQIETKWDTRFTIVDKIVSILVQIVHISVEL